MSKHILITGTGRSGTTFLMQLFTALELDTGFVSIAENINRYARAGMEINIGKTEKLPYIIKNPHFCSSIKLKDFMSRGREVEHVLVPMRDIFQASESRREIFRGKGLTTAGSLFGTDKPEMQEEVLEQKYYELMYGLTELEIPFTTLLFPRIVKDVEYLYRKVGFMCGGMSLERFSEGFRKASKPELVHEYKVRMKV